VSWAAALWDWGREGMEMEDGYDSGDGGPRRQEMVRAEAD